MKPTIRKPWERHRSVTKIEGDSVTDTSFGNDTDINHIVARCTRSGIWPPIPDDLVYEDVTNLQKPLDQLITDSKQAIANLEADADRNALEQAELEMHQERLSRFETLEKRLEALEGTPPGSQNDPVDGS